MIDHIVHHMQSRAELATHLYQAHEWFDLRSDLTAPGELLPASELLAIHRELHGLERMKTEATNC